MSKFGVVFLVVLLVAAAGAITQPRRTRALPAPAGVAANERLTALNGAVLVLLVVGVAITTLRLPQFLGAHYLAGLLLVPPLLLKLASTGYRFARYYSGAAAYRAAGPPPAILRWVVAPALVVSGLAVLATGIELWLFGLQFGLAWRSLHSLSAVVFVLAVGAHLLGHLRESAAAAGGEARLGRSREALTRRSLVLAGILLGAVRAAASLLYVSPFPSSAAG